MVGQGGEKGHQPHIFDDAAAERVGHGNLTSAYGLEQAGHAQVGILAQFQRITEAIIDAAQNHIHGLQSRQRFERNAAVNHRQIVALY